MVRGMAVTAQRSSALRRPLSPILSEKGLLSGSTAALPVACVLLFQSAAWAQYTGGSTPTTPAPAVSGIPANTGQYGLRVQSFVTVSEVFSDNVALAPAGSERSEWTTRFKPSVTITENGPRLRFNATYSPDILYRAIQSATDISHLLNASGNAELVQRLMYVDVRAAVTQQNVSLRAQQADSNLNTTSNRTSVKTYGISPYLRRDFGYDASGELRFSHDAVSFGSNSNNASASASERISAQLVSGPSFQLFNWSLVANKAHIEYTQTGQKVDSKTVSATAGRLITSELRLNANVGYEDSGYPAATGGTTKGAFWNVGPTWTPTPVTRISANFGHRYYGPSKTFNFDHRSSLSTWTVSYSENVTTTLGSLTSPAALDTNALVNSLLLSQYPDPIERQTAVQQFIATYNLPASLTVPLNFLTNSLYLDKRWQAAFGIQGIRNTVITSLFSSTRDSLSATNGAAGNFSVSQSIKQTGGSVTWSSRLTQTLISNASLGLTRNDLGAGVGVNRLNFLRFGLTEQFGPRLTGSVLLARQKSTSTLAGLSYAENSVSATLGMRF